ncbi:putative phosphoglycerol transferase [Candidatus Regiella insecticola LSR1]|uniref:Putative phosphoglycerol transferase n=1 Tax=Candidatus Regiella insecticola LSR1 TaxID=663321 RepID=E0WRC8_9ENTR|nr:alkaline phosphatase family protein [Candidatus Regiella insecticola]EFL92688.1 putative phosphoglycerol transferase [Candidatus Regiella insecticola LSR1]
MWFYRFRQACLALLFPWLLAVFTQSAGRAYLLFTHGASKTLADFSLDVTRMFWIGGLFDIRIASLLFVPCLLMAGCLAVSNRIFLIWQRFWPWVAAILSVIVLIMTVVNVFYYATYERFIDVFVFGLIEDDTVAVLSTVWQSYPVIGVLFCLGLFSIIVFWFYRRWQRWLGTKPKYKISLPISIIITVVILFICFLGMRGSVGTFPLRQHDVQVSTIKMLNMLTPNGLIAMYWAVNAHQKNNQFVTATNEKGTELLSRFLERPTQASLTPFIAKTDTNRVAKKNPPNVVLAVMESMGYHLQSLDHHQRDLLGALRQHWLTDWHFERFISEGDGTIDSLNRFFVRSPMSSISQSSTQTAAFISNMFTPYLTNGYKIIFVTSGNGAWQNLNQFLPRLGVSEFMEQNGLKKRYPDASIGTWGVPDEYMFRYMKERLAEADKKGEPIFMMSMSTTHHPPYKTPTGYRKTDVELTETEKQRLRNLATDDELKTVLNTLAYANDQLGLFISWVKSQALGTHTIIAATGDHNIRGIGYPDTHELVLGHAVPFYLYVPQDYRQNSYFDSSRVGSHKDILPTLYQLSLSETTYYRTGCNLLSKTQDNTWCQGYNPEVAITAEGPCILTVHKEFRPWANQKGLFLGDPKDMTPEQEKQCNRWSTFTDLLWWQLNRQVGGQKSH